MVLEVGIVATLGDEGWWTEGNAEGTSGVSVILFLAWVCSDRENSLTSYTCGIWGCVLHIVRYQMFQNGDHESNQALTSV